MNIYEILHTSNDLIFISDDKNIRGWDLNGNNINPITNKKFKELKNILGYEKVGYYSFSECYAAYLKYWKSITLENAPSFKFNKIDNDNISFESFFEIYNPIEKNEVIKQFETFGKDYERVKRENPKKVWTVLDGEGSNLILTNGIWFINRMFYIICEKECKEERGNININY